MDRFDALDLFYALLGELEDRCGGYRRLADCDGSMGWPARGVYFFFSVLRYATSASTSSAPSV